MKSTPKADTQKKVQRRVPTICGKVGPIFPNTKLELMRAAEGPSRMCKDGTLIVYELFVKPRISMLVSECIHICRSQKKRKVNRSHLRAAIIKMSSHKIPKFM
jgi:hypothetical protein